MMPFEQGIAVARGRARATGPTVARGHGQRQPRGRPERIVERLSVSVRAATGLDGIVVPVHLGHDAGRGGRSESIARVAATRKVGTPTAETIVIESPERRQDAGRKGRPRPASAGSPASAQAAVRPRDPARPWASSREADDLGAGALKGRLRGARAKAGEKFFAAGEGVTGFHEHLERDGKGTNREIGAFGEKGLGGAFSWGKIPLRSIKCTRAAQKFSRKTGVVLMSCSFQATIKKHFIP